MERFHLFWKVVSLLCISNHPTNIFEYTDLNVVGGIESNHVTLLAYSPVRVEEPWIDYHASELITLDTKQSQFPPLRPITNEALIP